MIEKRLCENCDGEYVYDWLGHKRSTCRKCWQEDKENIFDTIKKHRESVREIYGEINAVMYPLKWIDYLIEQAEKVKELEEKVEEGVKSHWGCAPCIAYDKLQAKAERYERVLKEIAEYEKTINKNQVPPMRLLIVLKKAKQALEGEE
jgi:hypothetical protein